MGAAGNADWNMGPAGTAGGAGTGAAGGIECRAAGGTPWAEGTPRACVVSLAGSPPCARAPPRAEGAVRA
jgi:hypothetical protein